VEEGSQPAADARLAGLIDWIGATGRGVRQWRLASADASFRRYIRVWTDDGVFVAMDAPPEQEDCRPFLAVAALMEEAGVPHPRIHEAAPERGYMLLDDLGERTFLDGLSPEEADGLMTGAIDSLVRWQRASRPGVLPPYDAALLRRELRLFPDWYAERHLGRPLSPAQWERWVAVEERLIEAALAQAPVYVHRDFILRNLMRDGGHAAVIDFQDAVYGPVAYDILCLVRDAFVDWPPEREERWFRQYWEAARSAGVPVPAAFETFRCDIDWIGVQRHLKVVGIFARLCYRDGKSHYLDQVPRFLRYLRRETADRAGLSDVSALLEEVIR